MDISSETQAIVTGGASGLGAAVALRLTQAGAAVTLLDMNAENGAAYATEIGAAFEQVNVADAESVARAIAAVRDRAGRIDILVNCAGIAPAGRTVSKSGPHDPATFAQTINVNLIGSFFCASQAAAVMAENTPSGPDGERGVIINTASVAAYDGQIGQAAYAASKGGIVGLTLPMARDLASLGIRVCAIAPGLFFTPLLAGLPEDVQESLGAQVPFPSRLGDPGEFASLVEHIISNRMLNGEVIRLDGAIRMAPK